MSKTAITIEIGGTKLQVALGNEAGEIVALRRGSVAPEAGAQGILSWLERETAALLKAPEALAHEKPVAAGVGFGGPVDSASGRVLTSHQVAGWEGFDLKPWFEQRLDLPTVVVNDSNAAGWAEFRKGAGQGTRNFFYMNIGSGIGGALVIDGKLYDGQGQGGGEVGHTYVPDWTVSTAGAADKLEHLCSGWAIERRLRALPSLPQGSPLWGKCGGHPESLKCAMLAEAAREGDAIAIEEIGRVALTVGRALANVITLFHPERIAMGGGVSLMGDVLLDPLRERVAEHVFGPFRNRYEILPCALGESVVLVGALLLAFEACR